MKVVIAHTDLRIYWPARIRALQDELEKDGRELFIIEIAGKGSPYAFADNAASTFEQRKNWNCLFPSEKMEDISSKSAAMALYTKLDEIQPDVVMAGAIAFTSGATAVRWAKENKKGVVIFDDTRMKDVPRNRMVNFIKKIIYHQVDAIFCPAPEWDETFLNWGFKKEQLFYGVDVIDNEFWNIPSSVAISRPTMPYFLFAGRFIEVKNLPFLLRAYKRYLNATPTNVISLLLVGDGSAKRLLNQLIIDEQVSNVFMLSFLNQQELKTAYQNAVALVLPSVQETWGLVVNEAMAAGLPVLVSDACGCASTLVRSNINGYSFSAYAEQELADLMMLISVKSKSELDRMGKASKDIISEWGLNKFTNGAVNAIDFALHRHKQRASLLSKIVLSCWRGRYRPI